MVVVLRDVGTTTHIKLVVSGNELYCCLGEQNWRLLEDLAREIRFLETRPMKTTTPSDSFGKMNSTLAD
ncbi:hypothetical protein N7449_012083 [Penicillium cf. viridicatum]|uniref:Uncharacterized protein n=1 Tax=Penicillium cf. viridicatum TaxID=2972119 RepID=A0A9W9IU74_9EURO|nr:hypothetical protein N7449_012083 [Penicillium cf. viridicatum]